jgi:hypothetical protein
VDFGLLLLIIFILAPLLDKLLKAGRPPEQQQPPQRPGQPGQRVPGTAGQEQQQRQLPHGAADEDEAAAAMLPDDLWEILTGERRPPQRPETSTGPAARTPSDAEPAATREPAAGRDATAGPLPHQRPAPDRSPRPAPSRPDPRETREAREARRAREAQEAREARGTREARPARDRTPAPVRTRRLPPVELRGPRFPDERARTRTPASPPPSAADDLVREVRVRDMPEIISLEAPIGESEERYARFQERRAGLAPAARVVRARGKNLYAPQPGEDLRRAIVLAEVLGRPRGLD